MTARGGAGALRVGIAHHLGWAWAIAVDPAHRAVDRRRLELVDPDLPAAPVHHEGGYFELHRSGDALDDDELAALVERVEASVGRCSTAALAGIEADLGPIASISIVAWPTDLPAAIAELRRPPHESRADSAMYRRLLAEAGEARGWAVHRYDAKAIEAEARSVLGDRTDEVLAAPRAALGPPWAKEHRAAFAAAVVAGALHP